MTPKQRTRLADAVSTRRLRADVAEIGVTVYKTRMHVHLLNTAVARLQIAMAVQQLVSERRMTFRAATSILRQSAAPYGP